MRTSIDPEWRATMRECRRCHSQTPPLIFSESHDKTAKPLFHEDGNLKSQVLFVVEAPNRTDTFDPDKGRMTVEEGADPAGRFFLDRLKELELKPEEIIVTNSVLCLPPRVKGKYPVKAKQKRLCSSNLRGMIESVNPKIVVPNGVEALSALNLIERHGLTLSKAVAQPHEWFGRIIFPLYHPSALALTTRNLEMQKEDYRKLKTLLNGL